MEKLVTSNVILGIIAGGQLGKMLIQEASKWDIRCYTMDNDEQCPASKLSTKFIKGSRFDFESVYNFGEMVDILTFEIESINVDALKALKSKGKLIVPDPSILELIQDKGKQKEFYTKNNIPTADYHFFENSDEITQAHTSGIIKAPFVQKLRKGGYDGRGIAVINKADELTFLLDGSSVIEEKIDIYKEISVIAARNKKGQIKCFPVVEMIFDPKENLVDMLLCPALINEKTARIANEIASEIIEALQMEGLLAVEFFIDTAENVLVNEMAPRPHNSGHHTIESIITSQFEQHLRAIFNLPLGSTKLKLPSVMVNILGEEGYAGPVKYEGLTECMAIEGVKIHLYGKVITKPYRKMGHVTILSDTIEDALRKAKQVKQLIKVKSWNENL